mgnify:CR=1 FL=1
MICALIFSPLLTASNLQSQSFALNRNAASTFLLEVIKPSFDEEELDASFVTSSLMLSGRVSVTKYFGLVGEVPFSHFGLNFGEGFETTDNSLGNIYLGIELMGRNSPLFVEVGGRLPIASGLDEFSEAPFSGYLTNFVERAEAFVPEAVPLNLAFNVNHKSITGLTFRLRGASTVWLATGERSDTELFFQYNAYVGFENPVFTVLAGASGRVLATEEGLDFGERSTHQFRMSGDVSLGVIRPGVFFQLPVDSELQDLVSAVFGVSLGVDLK